MRRTTLVIHRIQEVQEMAIIRNARLRVHLVAGADRTSRVMRTPAIVDGALVMMSLLAHPPHLLCTALRDHFGRQTTVPRVVPLLRQVRTTHGERLRVPVHLHAERTLVLEHRARLCAVRHHTLPHVILSLVALPPRLVATRRQNGRRMHVPVSCRMPLCRDLRVQCGERVCDGDPAVVAEGTFANRLGFWVIHCPWRNEPLVIGTATTLPPDLLRRPDRHGGGSQTSILGRMPKLDQLGALRFNIPLLQISSTVSYHSLSTLR